MKWIEEIQRHHTSGAAIDFRGHWITRGGAKARVDRRTRDGGFLGTIAGRRVEWDEDGLTGNAVNDLKHCLDDLLELPRIPT